jgi:hypothetical protein
MELINGKCREEFLKWIKNKKYSIIHDVGERDMNIVPLNEMFEQLDFSMQYGVLVDFFDANGIIIDIQIHTEPTMQGAKFTKFRPEILFNGAFHNVGASFGKRETAHTEAIKKANEIFNNKSK